MNDFTRRDFLRLSGITALPALSPAIFSKEIRGNEKLPIDDDERVFFIYDGPMYKPAAYIAKLQEINKSAAIEQDFYTEGGAVEGLLKKFIALTGKEAAIYMPSGTMANQLAIHVLSGDNTKVFVQETSHVYRDEADAAQSVFSKRLMPLAKGAASFTLQELQQAMEYYQKEEVFKSDAGVVSIENPVRRADGQNFPIEEIKKIAEWCRGKGLKLHLDGARLLLAAAFTGVSVKEYAFHFDTVYISLYKYLGAAGGAVLCGEKGVIDKMGHLVKIHGGSVYSNWANAAMASYHLDGFDARLKKAISQSKELTGLLNQLPGVKIAPIPNGTNMQNMQIDEGIDIGKLRTALREKHQIILGGPREDGFIKFTINETLSFRQNQQIAAAFKQALSESRK